MIVFGMNFISLSSANADWVFNAITEEKKINIMSVLWLRIQVLIPRWSAYDCGSSYPPLCQKSFWINGKRGFHTHGALFFRFLPGYLPVAQVMWTTHSVFGWVLTPPFPNFHNSLNCYHRSLKFSVEMGGVSWLFLVICMNTQLS